MVKLSSFQKRWFGGDGDYLYFVTRQAGKPEQERSGAQKDRCTLFPTRPANIDDDLSLGQLGQNIASAGNRTRINCLEGSYADHYTTDALYL